MEVSIQRNDAICRYVESMTPEFVEEMEPIGRERSVTPTEKVAWPLQPVGVKRIVLTLILPPDRQKKVATHYLYNGL